MRKIAFFMTICFVLSLNLLYAQSWNLTGNSNIDTSSILGTTNSTALRIFTKRAERLHIDTLGRIGIGTALPNASALLDLTSTNKGFLVPRLTFVQRSAISLPAQ